MSVGPRRLVGHNSPGHRDVGPTGHPWDMPEKPWAYDLEKGFHVSPLEAEVLKKRGRVRLDP